MGFITALSSLKGKKNIKNAVWTAMVPIVVAVVMLILCAIKGEPYLFHRNAANQWNVLLLSIVTTTFIAWGFSINLMSGRMDFSLGATMILGTVLAGKIVLDNGLAERGGFLLMLVLVIAFGVLLGAISGAVYAFTGLPSVISSLGLTLIYEGAGYILAEGKSVYYSIGVSSDLVRLGSSPVTMIVVLALGLAVMLTLMNFTTFGYNYRALVHGQKISVNTGINEKIHCIICYCIAGALVCVSSYFTTMYSNYISPAISLSSIGKAFSAFLPLFVGGWLASKCESQTAILVASISVSIINNAYSPLGVSINVQSLIGALLLLVFLIYLNNSGKLKEITFIKNIKEKLGKRRLINREPR